MPPPPAPPPMPEKPPMADDPRIAEAQTAERRRRLLARGRKSTILSGPMGDQSTANVGKTMLGG